MTGITSMKKNLTFQKQKEGLVDSFIKYFIKYDNFI